MSQAANPPLEDKTTVDKMSQIADGDIVEVLLRGPARNVNTFGLSIGRPPFPNRIAHDAEHVVSIEKVEPPYVPQHSDIIRDARDDLYGRGQYGWRITPGADIFGQRQPLAPFTLLVRDGQVVTS